MSAAAVSFLVFIVLAILSTAFMAGYCKGKAAAFKRAAEMLRRPGKL